MESSQSSMANKEQQLLLRIKAFYLAAAGVIQVTASVYLGVHYQYVITIPFTDVECFVFLGFYLMFQGIFDIVFAIRTGLTGTFSWTVYFVTCILSAIVIAYVRWVPAEVTIALMKWGLTKLAPMIVRHVAVVSLDLASQRIKKIKELILQVYRLLCERFMERMIANEFDNIRMHMDPPNGATLIQDALKDVESTMNEDSSILDRNVDAVVEYLPTEMVELSFRFISKETARKRGNAVVAGLPTTIVQLALLAGGFCDRAINCTKFVAVITHSVVECYFFARHFVRSLQEAIAIRRQRLQAPAIRQIPQPEVQEAAGGFRTEDFEQSVKSAISKKASEKFRRGLFQATAQTVVHVVIKKLRLRW